MLPNHFDNMSPRAVTHKDLVIYTAITGGYDALRPLPEGAKKGISTVAFVESSYIAPGNQWHWNVHPAYSRFKDPNRNAKIHKVLSHVYFPKHEYSLWIDGNIDIRFSYSATLLVRRYLADADIAVFRHPHRRCLYAEGAMCLDCRLDNANVIMAQMIRYTREGYPADNGLVEASIILRRHSTAVAAFNEAWWSEIINGSRRDQLSFNYVANKMGIRFVYIPGNLHDENNKLFTRREHNNAQNRRWAYS
jgi:alkaline ceramidase TOD1/glycosyltransferase MUCI70-like protein